MKQERSIVIAGGGITGLSAAYAAARRARELGAELSVALLESSDRFGGNLRTEHVGDFLVDCGPDSWVSTKPAATALARELGLTNSLVGTNPRTRRFFIVWNGRLHIVPEGVVLGVPTRWLPLARTGLFSLSGKLRMACEPWIARRSFDGDDDESIADFATRRLGREAAERLVAPLLGGISGADASDVSVRVGFPQLVAMEQQYGSLVRGMIAARVKRTPRESEDVPRSVFLSLKGGIEELVHALVGELRVLGVNLHAASPLRSIDREGDRWRVCAGGGLSLLADDVLLAIPSHRAAPILAPIDARSAEMLATIPFVSTSTVFLAYRRQDIAHPLDATGFVVPQTAGRPIAASTWVSSKWEARAPEGHVLVRVFIGGARGQEMLRRDDETLVDVSRRELGALMGLEATPLWSKVYRMDRVTPQMRVGHASRLRAIRQQLAASAPGVHLAGGGYDGVGIPDCVHQGTEAARVMIEGEPE